MKPASNADKLRIRLVEQKTLQTAINAGAYANRAKLLSYLKTRSMTVARDGDADLDIDSPRCGMFRVTLPEQLQRKPKA